MKDITERIKRTSEELNSKKIDSEISKKGIMKTIKSLEKEMNKLAKDLEFEKAALVRDEIKNFRKVLKK